MSESDEFLDGMHHMDDELREKYGNKEMTNNQTFYCAWHPEEGCMYFLGDDEKHLSLNIQIADCLMSPPRTIEHWKERGWKIRPVKLTFLDEDRCPGSLRSGTVTVGLDK